MAHSNITPWAAGSGCGAKEWDTHRTLHDRLCKGYKYIGCVGCESDIATLATGTLLGVKRVDKIRWADSGIWTIADADNSETPRDATDNQAKVDKYAEWAEYALVIRRTVVPTRISDYPNVTTTFLIRSYQLRRALREVMKFVASVDWNRLILKLDPQLLLSFLPKMKAFCDSPDSSEGQDSTAKKHLLFLIEVLESEYASTLLKRRASLEHGNVTFPLLSAIFIPGDIIFAPCETTGESRAFRLKKIQIKQQSLWRTDPTVLELTCEYLDAENPSVGGQRFGWANHTITIQDFDGVQRITELVAYPFRYHATAAHTKQKLTDRGREWAKLQGVHHKQYHGLASRTGFFGREVVTVDGRIMIDRGTFERVEPGYSRPKVRTGLFGLLMDDQFSEPKRSSSLSVDAEGLKDEDFFLATPILYGFSLTTKRWFEFNVACVTDIEWIDDGFRHLAIDSDRKTLIQSLIKSHASLKESGSVDDFVAGKGAGLIINLFGPPGVGKTLTVEATSEHLRKPLYVVSAGELGTTATSLDKALTEMFAFVPRWDTIVLIDEADVFLEERGTADVERNAMVAIFLRQLEYFKGILFLTTNRVKSFDAAFQSRIHLSLRYTDLSCADKEQLWRAFLDKTRTTGLGLCDPSAGEMQTLSQMTLNGRQIKNIVKLSVALASEKKEALTYAHLVNTMRMTDDWVQNSTGTPQ